MLSISILFLLYCVYTLVNGRAFHTTINLGTEEVILKSKLGDRYSPNMEVMLKILALLLLFLFPLIIIELVFLTKAIHIDPFYVPSLIALSVFLTSLFAGIVKGFKKPSLITEEDFEKYRRKNTRKRTLFSTISALFWTVYFGYITYALMFIIQ